MASLLARWRHRGPLAPKIMKPGKERNKNQEKNWKSERERREKRKKLKL